ncbi:tetratricopeptide repeat-containing protein [uncultured Parasphingorhabdus sp.]|uniref:tetratricopeptide repeat-containing protein n=1 Tax=uncultured Parasphingorhabdus sp. TaxID=2709694 RepID=UPI0030DA07B3
MTPHYQILSIARGGNSARAWALFLSLGWDERKDDPKALTLKGRLLKDQAKATQGADRVRLYGEAAEAYAAAAALERDSYPLINAAALALLGGKPERAHSLAQETLALLESGPDQGENAYWREATRAEALLLLGDDTGARAALADGIAQLPRAWEDHAATIGQFELILAEQGRDAGWLDRHRPPPSLYFSGIIGLDDKDEAIRQDIDAIIAREQPGFGFGALAAGADILIAEALHKAGAELHIILPYPVDRFRALSVAPSGDHWLARFDALVEVAVQLDVLTELPDEEERSIGVAVELADLVTMGQCVRNAGVLQSRPKALTITGIGDEPRRQHLVWADTGHDQFMIAVARKVDHHSMTKLADAETKKIAAILWVDGLDMDALAALPEGRRNFQPAGDARYRISTDLADLLATSRSLLQHNVDNRISLLIDIIDPQRPAASLLEQASDMARASSGGAVLTDYKSAMVLTLEPGKHTLEEIGELQTANGPLPLWSLA